MINSTQTKSNHMKLPTSPTVTDDRASGIVSVQGCIPRISCLSQVVSADAITPPRKYINVNQGQETLVV